MKNKSKLILILSLAIVLLGGGFFLYKNHQNNNGSGDHGGINLQATKYMEVECQYGKLYYPKNWEEKVRVYENNSDICMVEFYGTVEGKEEVQLFNIVFGGVYGSKVGELEIDGNILDVSVMLFDPIFDETWTEDEKNMIYSMQEDMNYILLELPKIKGYRGL